MKNSFGNFGYPPKKPGKIPEFTHFCEHFKQFLPAAGCIRRQENATVGSFCRKCDGAPFRQATAVELEKRKRMIKNMQKETIMGMKTGDRKRFETLVLDYLAERQDKGIAIQHLSQRFRRLWPNCPIKVERDSLQRLVDVGRIKMVVEGTMVMIYSLNQALYAESEPVPIAEPVEETVQEADPPKNPGKEKNAIASEGSDNTSVPKGHIFQPQQLLNAKKLKEMAAGPLQRSADPKMAARIAAVCDEMKRFLLAKNQSYGNSAAEPVRIFSKVDPIEQINIRIDDKLSRLMHGTEYPGDDTELDLIGYLLLKRALVLDPARWNL